MTIKVLLADDHAIVRQGIRALLEDAAGIEVIAEAEDGAMAVAIAKQARPDVVIMDINMPNVDGIEAMRRIRGGSRKTEVLMLSMHDKIELIHQALQNGARGYILKASLFDELEAGIRTVAAGELFRSDVVNNYLEQYLTAGGEIPTNPLDRLTKREREVLELLARGYRSAEIAEQLSLSKKTIDKHRTSVMKKLNVGTPIELGRLYARHNRTADQ